MPVNESASLTERIFRVLEAFRAGDVVLSASDIARRAGLPMATAHRIVADLVTHGVLERGTDRRVRVGMRLWEIANASSTLRLRDVAMPYMVQLHEAVGQVVQLTVLDHGEVLSLEVLMPRRPTSLNIARAGTRLPVLASAPGMVLLAYSDSELRDRLLGNSKITRFTEKTIVDREGLRQEVASARSSEHFVAEGWMTPEVSSIAVAILGDSGLAIGALSITMGHNQPIHGVLPALRATAEGISTGMSRASSPTSPHINTLRQRIRRSLEHKASAAPAPRQS